MSAWFLPTLKTAVLFSKWWDFALKGLSVLKRDFIDFLVHCALEQWSSTFLML